MFVKRMKSGINLSDIDLLSIHTHKLQGTSRGIRKNGNNKPPTISKIGWCNDILLGRLYISCHTDQTHFDYLILNYIAPPQPNLLMISNWFVKLFYTRARMSCSLKQVKSQMRDAYLNTLVTSHQHWFIIKLS